MRVRFNDDKHKVLEKYPIFLHATEEIGNLNGLTVVAVIVESNYTNMYLIVPGIFIPSPVLFSDLHIIDDSIPSSWVAVAHKEQCVIINSFSEWANKPAYYYNLTEGFEFECLIYSNYLKNCEASNYGR